MDNQPTQDVPEKAATPAPITPEPVVPAPAPEVYTAPDVMVENRESSGKKKKLLMIILPVVFLLLAGGGALGYYFVTQSPNYIINNMVEKMSEVKTVAYSMDMTMDTETSSPSSSSFAPGVGAPVMSPFGSSVRIQASGVSDATNQAIPKATMKMVLSTGSGGISASFGFEMRSIGKVMYAQATDIPDLGFIDLSSIKNKWVKIDSDTLAKQYGSTYSSIYQVNKQLTPEELKDLEKLYKKFKILTNLKKESAETINGVDTHHFSFDIDKQQAKQFLVEAYEIIERKKITSELEKMYGELFSTVTFTDNNIWIGKKDNYLYKFGTTIKAKGTSTYSSDSTMKLTAGFTDHNKTVIIDEPQQFVTLEELMQSAMQQYMSSESAKPTLPVTPPSRGAVQQPINVLGAKENSPEVKMKTVPEQLFQFLLPQTQPNDIVVPLH